jgi:hypothetical protein
MRAANVALRLRSKDNQDKAQEAADNALKKAVVEEMKNLRVYFMVDISGSMEQSIEEAKRHIARFLQAFPPEQIHVAVFNTAGREVKIPHASAAGVENAFRGIRAGGGTDYGSGVQALQHFKPKADEDVLFFFVGDEEANGFDNAVRASGLNPMAFGLVKIRNSPHVCVQGSAAALGIPCFLVDEATFADPYAIPRTIRNLIAATPINRIQGRAPAAPRQTLVDQILKTPLMAKPAWAT